MASTTIPISCIFTTNLSSSFPHPFSKKYSKISINLNVPKHYNTISCEASSNDDDHKNLIPSSDNISEGKLDRRNVLLGLGGLYGAYTFAPSDPFAMAAPVPAPDISKCGEAIISFSKDKVPFSCCPPPFTGTITDYQVPSFKGKELNVRPAAHTVDDVYKRKYKAAIRKMKELPYNDPRNFYQQANVHCAYCNGAYKLGDKAYDIHPSWLFYPFHRWYLYFFERILQSLIGDETFALPYWNWDNEPGMYFPANIFDNSDVDSPLYDEFRNPNHGGRVLLDLGYAGQDVATKKEQIVKNNNKAIMYRQMVTNATCPLLFFGATLRADGFSKFGGVNGTVVNVPHNSIHRWVGDPRTKHNEDMGNFYSAARDPVFYCHHANVDRMWTIWKTLDGNSPSRRKDITDEDYLNTSFLFYDENKNPVRVKIGDCLNNEDLGYKFQEMATPWKDFKPTPKSIKTKPKNANSIPFADDKNFLPATLTKTLTFYVKRSLEDNEKKEELLNLYLEYDDKEYIRFDVFLNAYDEEVANKSELDTPEYASSFANLAHVHEGGSDNPAETTWRLPITELLKDLKIEGDDKVAVTLVPKCKGSSMTITKAETTVIPYC